MNLRQHKSCPGNLSDAGSVSPIILMSSVAAILAFATIKSFYRLIQTTNLNFALLDDNSISNSKYDQNSIYCTQTLDELVAQGPSRTLDASPTLTLENAPCLLPRIDYAAPGSSRLNTPTAVCTIIHQLQSEAPNTRPIEALRCE
jgi:hypothetical protein